MGRRLNLSHLSEEECDRILAVIQRDFELRVRENERISKLESELQDQACQRNVLAQRKQFNEKSCILCCSTFNLLFNKKLLCQECQYHVCRNCAVWNVTDKNWYCKVCDQQRSLRAQSCEWFYENVNMRFSRFGSAKVLMSLFKPKKDVELFDELDVEDKDINEVQSHIETVIEGFLGESLDSASVHRSYNNLLYDKMFLDHQDVLFRAVMNFSRALLLAIQNKPFEGNNTPTSTHASLKLSIQNISSDADSLPCLQQESTRTHHERGSDASDDSSSDDSTSIKFESYEDLLVVAVINKAVEICQRKYSLNSLNHVNGSSKALDPDIIQTARKEHIDVGIQSDLVLSNTDDEQDETESDEFFWAKEPKTIKRVIEEQVEEITEAVTESEDDHSRMTLEYDEVPDVDAFYTLDWDTQDRVSFPEMGVDIISPDLTYGSENGDLNGTKIASVLAWEDNWLFQKKKLAFGGMGCKRSPYFFDPINMLIPNPDESERIRLGDRDLEELSEMSEKNSVGSLYITSESESEDSDHEDTSLSSQKLNKELQELTQNIVSEFSNSRSDLLDVENTNSSKTASTVSVRPVPKPRHHVPLKVPVPSYKPPEKRTKSSGSLKFISEPENTSLHAGKCARFVCEPSGPKLEGVAWFRNGTLLEGGEQHNIYSKRGNKFVLEIYGTSAADSSVYSVVAYSDKGEIWTDFRLIVKESTRACTRPEFIVPLHVMESTGTECARLSCTVNGYPEPRLTFLHDSKKVVNQNNFSFERQEYGEWLLQITSPKPEHEGEYIAMASNKAGQATSKTIFRLESLNVVPEDPKKKEERSPQRLKGRQEEQLDHSPLVIQRTWADRVAELKKTESLKKPPTVSHDHIDDKPAYNNHESVELSCEDSFSDSNYFKPGSIAEREHNKWLNAVSLPNNPYSTESLNRRLKNRGIDRSPFIRSFSQEEMNHVQDLPSKDQDNDTLFWKKDWANSSDYRRDYYINRKSEQGVKKNATHNEDFVPEETLNSLEEKMYTSQRKVFRKSEKEGTLEKKRFSKENGCIMGEDNRSRVSSGVMPYSVTNNAADNNLYSSLTSDSQDLNSGDFPSLPSVKELATRFLSPGESVSTSSNSARPTQDIMDLLSDKEVILVEKRTQHDGEHPNGRLKNQQPRPIKKVHSLTARSLSKEFRERAQKNIPRPMNRTVSVSLNCLDSLPSSLVQGEITPGYASDESSISSTSVNVSKTRPKQKVSRSILQRASYWERRAEQGLLSDSSVYEEFPSVEEVPP